MLTTYYLCTKFSYMEVFFEHKFLADLYTTGKDDRRLTGTNTVLNLKRR